MKKSWGFSMLELVMVILIIAIIATTAMPRFVDNSKQAHNSSVAATGGALASAVILLRSQWVSNGKLGEQDRVKGYGNGDVATTEQGWPSDGGQGAASNHKAIIEGDHQRCRRIWQGLLVKSSPSVVADETLASDYLAIASSGPLCVYRYRKDKAKGEIIYNLATGDVQTLLH